MTGLLDDTERRHQPFLEWHTLRFFIFKKKKSNVNLIGNIEKIIEIQKKKEEQINAEERTKMLEKQAKKEQKKQQDQIEAKDNIRKNKLFDKYGKFDIDYFDGK